MKLAHDSTYIPDGFVYNNDRLSCIIVGYDNGNDLKAGSNAIQHWPFVWGTARFEYRFIPDQFADNYDLECIIVGHDMGGTNGAGYATAKYWPYFWINLAVGFFLHTRWFLV